jgi:hypothetical protein
LVWNRAVRRTNRAAVAVLILIAIALAGCKRAAAPAARTTSGGKAGGRAAPAQGWRVLELPAPLAQLFETGKWDRTPPGFRIVTLSFLADACAARARRDADLKAAAGACVSRALELARKTRPAGLRVDAAEEGLWLSHLALILGALDTVLPCADEKAHAEIANALARRSLREPTAHVPSYAATAYRWPADQTATLAALARFDRAHGAHLADEPVRRWRERMLKQTMDAGLGLPWSEATGKAKGARDPRGCALSWQTRYLNEVDPALAGRWWDRYKDAYLVDKLVLVGFREWPPGRDRPADADSGPIVNGVGSAATALAIGAARTMGDAILARRLEATATLVEGAVGTNPAFARHASTALAASIRYLGKHATR